VAFNCGFSSVNVNGRNLYVLFISNEAMTRLAGLAMARGVAGWLA